MKTVIITGANGGLGTPVTQYFLEKKYRVIATVHREDARGQFKQHENLDVQLVNLTAEKETDEFVRRSIDKYGKIDSALLLAGGFAMGGIRDVTAADIHKQMALNFETAFNITRPLFPHMIENDRGRVIFIGTRPALLPAAGKDMIAYALSKSMLFKLADFLNQEAKGKNVNVTVIAPSTIDTEENRKSMPRADFTKWVSPAKLAAIMEFLVSDNGDPLRETVLKVYNNA